MKTLFLCGFMGCGKSTIGKSLAQLMRRQFIDLDSYIVDKSGMTIPDIFARHSEEYFRSLESRYIEELTGRSAVIATGGGALVSADNAALARKGGIIAFLDVQFNTCYMRIKDDENRPLVMNNSVQDLERLFSMRRDLYIANSDIVIDADAPIEIVAHRIKAAYNDALDKAMRGD